jgi:hypothetical protein
MCEVKNGSNLSVAKARVSPADVNSKFLRVNCFVPPLLSFVSFTYYFLTFLFENKFSDFQDYPEMHVSEKRGLHTPELLLPYGISNINIYSTYCKTTVTKERRCCRGQTA